MILNFLQTRNPPILPSLHEKLEKKHSTSNGMYPAFNDDIESLRGFGEQNKETLGDLIFQFFRRYAHDIDYEKNVISVREGRLISKEAKKWHLMQNNRLCVEEPFNVDRNLGNTADDTSFRGIHLELRRAFDYISEGRLSQCLEQYTFPPIEEKVWEKPASKPPPVLTRSRSQSQSSRGKGGHGSRGGRHNSSSQHPRGRRASSAAATNKYPLPSNNPHNFGDRSAPSQEQIIQAQFEQLQLYRQLFDEMQTLQRQEYELRLKQAQNQLQAEMEIHASGQSHLSGAHSSREQSRRHHLTTQTTPSTAPLRGTHQFPPLMYPQVHGTPHQSVHTQPSSPSLRATQADLRRSIHRTSTNDDSSSANVRSHSQPARSVPANIAMQGALPPMNSQQPFYYQTLRQQQKLHHDRLHHDIIGQGGHGYLDSMGFVEPRRQPMPPSFEESVPKEYAGYWINDSPPSHTYRDDLRIPRAPFNQDIYPRVKGVPPGFNRLRESSRSPSPSPSPSLPLRDRSFSLQSASTGLLGRPRFERVHGTASPARGPIIVNGTDTFQASDAPPMLESSSHNTTVSDATSSSEDPNYETPTTGEMEALYNGVFEDNFAIDQARHLYHGHPMHDGLRHTHFDPRNYMEPSARRLANQPMENGSSQMTSRPTERKQGIVRGLNIQFGEVEYARPSPKADSSTSQEPSRSSKQNIGVDPPSAPLGQNQPEKSQLPMPLLSPVREVRTPSPSRKIKEASISTSKGSSTKRMVGKMDLYIPPFTELVKIRQEKEKSQQQQQQQQQSWEKANNHRPNGTLSSTPNGTRPSHITPSVSPDRVTQVLQNTPSISPRPSGMQPQINGWQQQASKRNRKSRSRPGSGNYPAEPLPANEAERKGG